MCEEKDFGGQDFNRQNKGEIKPTLNRKGMSTSENSRRKRTKVNFFLS